MSKKKELTPLAIAVSVALTASFGAASAASTDSSPFAMTSLPTGNIAAHEEEGSGGDEGEHSHDMGEEGDHSHPEGSCGGDQGDHSHPDDGHGGDHGGGHGSDHGGDHGGGHGH